MIGVSLLNSIEQPMTQETSQWKDHVPELRTKMNEKVHLKTAYCKVTDCELLYDK